MVMDASLEEVYFLPEVLVFLAESVTLNGDLLAQLIDVVDRKD